MISVTEMVLFFRTLLLPGIKLTVALTLTAILLGTLGGLLLTICRSASRTLAAAASVYVRILRGTPLLVQLYFLYYGLPAAGIKLSAITAAVAGLSLNAAAYISEVFRGGLESIPASQEEAARALGLNQLQTLRLILLPQAVRRALPALCNEYVAMLKDTSLVSTLALVELVRAARLFESTTFKPVPAYLAVGTVYLVLTTIMENGFKRAETTWRLT
jgi:polar amino acid transport system permease protein